MTLSGRSSWIKITLTLLLRRAGNGQSHVSSEPMILPHVPHLLCSHQDVTITFYVGNANATVKILLPKLTVINIHRNAFNRSSLRALIVGHNHSTAILNYLILHQQPWHICQHLTALCGKYYSTLALKKTMLTLSLLVFAVFIGVAVGIFAFVVGLSIEGLNRLKFDTIRGMIHDHGGFLAPYCTMMFFCMGYAAISSCVVVFISPIAAGSGIPEVKTYLNGIHIKGNL